MIHLLALTSIVVAQATLSPSTVRPTARPVPRAAPQVVATPQSTRGLVLPAAPAVAPGFRPGAPELPSGDIVGNNGAFVGISLDDAVAMALTRNTDLIVSQSNRRIAGFQIIAARGAYDLLFAIAPAYTFGQTAPLSAFQSGPEGQPIQQSALSGSAQLSSNLPTGGRFSAGTTASRTNNNSALDSFNPYYQAALAVNYTQPLARNRAIDETRRQIALTKINNDLSGDTLLLTASNTLSNALQAYYNLVAAWRNVAIQEDALRQAKSQSESNGRLVLQGEAAPVDVVESDTQVQVFQNNVYSAIQNVASYQNQLKSLILSDPADPAWSANLVPTSPITYVPAEPALNDVLAEAIRNRPEVAQLREQVRNADVNTAFYKNQTLPQVDLNVGISENGFAGTATPASNKALFTALGAEFGAVDQLAARVNALTPGQPPIFGVPPSALGAPLLPYTIGGLGQAYAGALAGRFPAYSVSANLGLPLRNRTAEANLGAAREQRNQLATSEVALVQRLQNESRNALQSYRSARSRLIAAGAARQAAEKVASSEIRKFHAGESTTFLVLQRQIELANDRGLELQAQTDVQKATVELDRVTGSILPRYGVDVSSLGTAGIGATPDLLRPPPSPAPKAPPAQRTPAPIALAVPPVPPAPPLPRPTPSTGSYVSPPLRPFQAALASAPAPEPAAAPGYVSPPLRPFVKALPRTPAVAVRLSALPPAPAVAMRFSAPPPAAPARYAAGQTTTAPTSASLPSARYVSPPLRPFQPGAAAAPLGARFSPQVRAAPRASVKGRYLSPPLRPFGTAARRTPAVAVRVSAPPTAAPAGYAAWPVATAPADTSLTTTRYVSPPLRPRYVSPPLRPRYVSPPLRPRYVSPPLRPRYVSPPLRPWYLSPPLRPFAGESTAAPAPSPAPQVGAAPNVPAVEQEHYVGPPLRPFTGSDAPPVAAPAPRYSSPPLRPLKSVLAPPRSARRVAVHPGCAPVSAAQKAAELSELRSLRNTYASPKIDALLETLHAQCLPSDEIGRALSE